MNEVKIWIRTEDGFLPAEQMTEEQRKELGQKALQALAQTKKSR